jgi:hypothetical protein
MVSQTSPIEDARFRWPYSAIIRNWENSLPDM